LEGRWQSPEEREEEGRREEERGGMKGQRGNILTRLHTIMACSIPKEHCTNIVEVIH